MNADAHRRFPVDPHLGVHEPEAHPEYADVVAFFGHLAYTVAPLRGVLAAHLEQCEGEMLPTLLMQDITAWLLGELRGGPSGRTMQVLQLLDEAYVAAPEALRSVMVIGFLEHIPGFAGASDDAEGLGVAVRAGLGPTLTAVLREVEGWRGHV
ncbi:hypothetical protein [Demequina sp. NBRC 110052]|uniref:hypothetical protein n=1 Tax=Demequina sp. NBRC 110052 TaxID=1570341 RepID=UPI000A06ADB0|nr:hypothetical protein [Demequina sp. NBRC 110052]